MRRIYRGEITRWKQLDARLPDLPVVLVSRNAESGTRQIFQRRVLGAWERVPSTSLDCVRKDDATAPVTRCELDSTQKVLDTVAEIPGAIGYSELTLAASTTRGCRPVALDGAAASVADIENGRSDYPYRGVEYAYTYNRPPMRLARRELPRLRRPGHRGERHPCPRPAFVLGVEGAADVRRRGRG